MPRPNMLVRLRIIQAQRDIAGTPSAVIMIWCGFCSPVREEARSRLPMFDGPPTILSAAQVDIEDEDVTRVDIGHGRGSP